MTGQAARRRQALLPQLSRVCRQGSSRQNDLRDQIQCGRKLWGRPARKAHGLTAQQKDSGKRCMPADGALGKAGPHPQAQRAHVIAESETDRPPLNRVHKAQG